MQIKVLPLSLLVLRSLRQICNPSSRQLLRRRFNSSLIYCGGDHLHRIPCPGSFGKERSLPQSRERAQKEIWRHDFPGILLIVTQGNFWNIKWATATPGTKQLSRNCKRRGKGAAAYDILLVFISTIYIFLNRFCHFSQLWKQRHIFCFIWVIFKISHHSEEFGSEMSLLLASISRNPDSYPCPLCVAFGFLYFLCLV